MMQVTKVWWDGEKLMAEPIDPAAVYKEPLDSLLDEAKLLADDRPVEIGHLPQWALDAEHMIRRLVKAVNAAPQPAQQEPVAWMYEDMMGLVGVRVQKEKPIVARPITPLYTSPPAQRTWVGLSPADRGKCLSAGDAHGWIGVMEATEARLKELNT